MPDAPTLIHSLTLTGFRAYLESVTFDFLNKPNIGIFGPNGKGKTGLGDSLEFLFSKDGTIKRLGVRAVNNQAGVAALAHDLAADKKQPSEVHIKLKQGKTVSECTRSVSDRTRPSALGMLIEHLKVDPIIRGYTLRHFVEEQSSEERYAEVARWLQLSPLVDIQKNLRLLRQQVKADADAAKSSKQIDSQISKATSASVSSWDEPSLITYANGLLSPLDATLKMTALDRADPAFADLVARANAEEREVGVAGLRQLAVAIESVFCETPDEKTASAHTTGALAAFESAYARKIEAGELERAERSKAANAVFAEVWSAAEPLFRDGGPVVESCPVCATPLANTAAGSREGIRDHIRTHRAELAAYATSKTALDGAARTCNAACQTLIAKLAVLRPLIPDTEADCMRVTTAYTSSIGQWTDSPVPDSSELKTSLRAMLAAVTYRIAAIEARQGESTYAKALAKIESLLEIKELKDLQSHTSREFERLLTALNEQAAFISGEIRKQVQTLLDLLRAPTNELYKAIQGNDAVPVRLELPSEDETNQQRLALLVDFSPGRAGVPPTGYLSDSQIHSLALALRLAAIRAFNTGAPIAVLDDIVTSYDADHRRTIAGMIAEKLSGLQLIVTTHDQRFFCYLKDQLPPATWTFTQIIRLDREFGPRFTNHKVSDEMIEERWRQGQSAANEMRQAEEEWLLDRCRDFGVDIRIREVDRAYSYERSELACALATFLKKAGLTPPPVPGVSNRFLTSLQKGEVENFGSHFQEGPYGDGSIGDEKARWAEFTFFRDQFVCPGCGRTKFKRPHVLGKPVCAAEKCEAQFRFATPPLAATGT